MGYQIFGLTEHFILLILHLYSFYVYEDKNISTYIHINSTSCTPTAGRYSKCTFPSWVTHQRRWHALDHGAIYVVSHTNTTLRLHHAHSSSSSPVIASTAAKVNDVFSGNGAAAAAASEGRTNDGYSTDKDSGRNLFHQQVSDTNKKYRNRMDAYGRRTKTNSDDLGE